MTDEHHPPHLHPLAGGGHVAYRFLIHGYRDDDVPWRTSLRLASRLHSRDVTVEIVADGDHRLSRNADLARLARTLHGVLGSRGA